MGVKIHYGPKLQGKWREHDDLPSDGKYVFVIWFDGDYATYGLGLGRFGELVAGAAHEWGVAGDNSANMMVECWWDNAQPLDPHAAGLALLHFNVDNDEWSVGAFAEEYEKYAHAEAVITDKSNMFVAGSGGGAPTEQPLAGFPLSEVALGSKLMEEYIKQLEKPPAIKQPKGPITGLPFDALAEIYKQSQEKYLTDPPEVLQYHGQIYLLKDVMQDFAGLTTSKFIFDSDVVTPALPGGTAFIYEDMTTLMPAGHPPAGPDLYQVTLDFMWGSKKFLKGSFIEGSKLGAELGQMESIGYIQKCNATAVQISSHYPMYIAGTVIESPFPGTDLAVSVEVMYAIRVKNGWPEGVRLRHVYLYKSNMGGTYGLAISGEYRTKFQHENGAPWKGFDTHV